jgi:tRNA pseudouridine55 synthase
MKKTSRPLHGWINCHKPLGLSSAAVVGRVRRILSVKSIGHAGTLDPLASGVLPLALGEATKLLAWWKGDQKIYRFTVKFGERTSTDDLEGEIVATSSNRPTAAEIFNALPKFCGDIQQIPPRYSAIKINGQRSYALARAGEICEIPARQVRIDSIRLLEFHDANSSTFEVVCGPGTYIRALARDLALELGSEGHVISLIRVAVGKFHLDDAISLETLEEIGHIARPFRELNPLPYVLDDILVITADDSGIARLSRGQNLPVRSSLPIDTVVQVQNYQGMLCAMAKIIFHCNEQQLRPLRIFHPN